jgi:hypothetical protein
LVAFTGGGNYVFLRLLAGQDIIQEIYKKLLVFLSSSPLYSCPPPQ